MRRLLLVAMLVVASRGAAQKRNEWSWGADDEDPKPKEDAKKVSGRSASVQDDFPFSINNFDVAAPPHLGPAPPHHLGPAPPHHPGPAPPHHPGPAPPHHPGLAPEPHVIHAVEPHVVHVNPHHLTAAPTHPLSPGPASHLGGHPSVAPVVTGHQLRGEDRSLVVGHGDGQAEGRFLGIKDKLCEVGLAYDCHKGHKGYGKGGYSHHDISYVQPVQVVAVGGPIAAIPIAHKGYGYKGKGHGVPVTYPAAAPVYHPPPVQPSYGPPPSYGHGHSHHEVVNHVHTHKHLYDAYSGVGGSYGKDNSFGSSSSPSIHETIDKLGGGFGPIPNVPQRPSPFSPSSNSFPSSPFSPSSNSFPSSPFSPSSNSFSSSPFLNDCQCVDARFCSPSDVIPRSNDILQHITARNKRTETLSTDSKDEAVAASEGSEVVVKNEKVEKEGKTSRRRRDTVIFEDSKRPSRDTMVFRETFGGLGLRGPVPSASRQGLGALSGPCGFGQVCCRSPIFRRQRAISTCGRKSNTLSGLGRVKTTRFEQGDTDFGEYPWHAAILRRDAGENVYVCGAALIDSRHLVTAAHCITGLTPSELKVRMGEWDVSGKTEFYQHFDTNVEGMYSHPDFYAGNLQNDIAVIKVQTPVDLVSHPHIAPVCLPERFTTYDRQRCFVSGWGKDSFGNRGNFQSLLKEVDLPIVDRRTCQSAFRRTKLGSQFLLHDGMICAGGEEGKDACEGDGGSPLVCQGTDGNVELAGLVSWGLGCGDRGIPGVYTNVPYYMDWIRSITRT